jgi:hypothetical protein
LLNYTKYRRATPYEPFYTSRKVGRRRITCRVKGKGPLRHQAAFGLRLARILLLVSLMIAFEGNRGKKEKEIMKQ